MARRVIKIPSRTGSLSLGQARATALAMKAIDASQPRRSRAEVVRAVRANEVLAAVVGRSAMPRSEVTRKIWDYIRRNGLVDRRTGRTVNADSKLRPVFGGKRHIQTEEVLKLVSRHLK